MYDNSLGVLTRKKSQVNSHYKFDKSNIFWYHFFTTFDNIVDDGVIPKPPLDQFSWAFFYSVKMVDRILLLTLALILLKMNTASIFLIVESKVIGGRFHGSPLIFSGVWGSFLVRLLFLICCWIYLQLFWSLVLGIFLITSTATPSHPALFLIFWILVACLSVVWIRGICKFFGHLILCSFLKIRSLNFAIINLVFAFDF